MLCKFSKVISCIRGGCAVKRIDISRVIQIIECHIVAGGKSRQKNITRLVISFLGFIPLTCLWLFHERRYHEPILTRNTYWWVWIESRIRNLRHEWCYLSFHCSSLLNFQSKLGWFFEEEAPSQKVLLYNNSSHNSKEIWMDWLRSAMTQDLFYVFFFSAVPEDQRAFLRKH